MKSFPYYRQHVETLVDVEEQLQNEGGDYNPNDYASTKDVNNASDNNVDIQFVSKASKRSQSQIESSSTSKK